MNSPSNQKPSPLAIAAAGAAKDLAEAKQRIEDIDREIRRKNPDKKGREGWMRSPSSPEEVPMFEELLAVMKQGFSAQQRLRSTQEAIKATKQ
jgi:hypothetical protein